MNRWKKGRPGSSHSRKGGSSSSSRRLKRLPQKGSRCSVHAESSLSNLLKIRLFSGIEVDMADDVLLSAGKELIFGEGHTSQLLLASILKSTDQKNNVPKILLYKSLIARLQQLEVMLVRIMRLRRRQR